MALHKVDSIDSGYTSTYIREMIKEFLDSDMDIAEIDVPEGSKPLLFNQNVWQVIKRDGLKDKVSVHKRKDKVYLVKK